MISLNKAQSLTENLPKSQLAHKMTQCTNISANDSKGQQSSQSSQGLKQEIFIKPSQILAPKGITHQKLLKLIKAILPCKNIIGGYLKPIHIISVCNPICKPKCN